MGRNRRLLWTSVVVVMANGLVFAGMLASEVSQDSVKETSPAIVWSGDLVMLRTKDQKLDRYLRAGEERLLKACKRIGASGAESTLEIELTINRFGEVAKSRVERSSGSSERDRAAQRALAIVIGDRPSIEGLACPTCSWYVRVRSDATK